MTRRLSSLRFRLIALILLAVIAFGVIVQRRKASRSNTQQVQRNALERLVSPPSKKDFRKRSPASSLSRVPQVREHDKNSCGKFLAGLLEPLYADLGIANVKGNLLCSALPAAHSLLRSKGPHQSHVVETHDFSVGQIRIDRETGMTLMDLGFPILDSPGVLRAVVVAALNLSWLSRLTAENHLYPGATFTLVDGDGNVFLRYPQGRESIGQPIFAKALDDGALSQETERAVESLGSDGVQRLIAFARLKSPVGGKPIYAAIDISAAMAIEEADQILVHDLITLGLLTALTLVAAWFGADIVVLRRIRDIVAATNKSQLGT
jgi:hypothetical protein